MDPNKLSKGEKAAGTPLYLSPEIIKNQPYDQRVDIWAIGCALYQLSALVPPFYENDIRNLFNLILTSEPVSIPGYLLIKT